MFIKILLSRWAAMLPLASFIVSLSACQMDNLPRNMKLRAFDPHRADFVCRHEAEANPPITPEADALFLQGMAATSYERVWPHDTRDFSKAADLWQQAASMGHWKAAMNLADLYEHGEGVGRDTEKAVQVVEALMAKGVPAAFDRMGKYHLGGIGVKGDVDRAYAFWQLAAEMGSASAQAYLGAKLKGTYDNPAQGFWGNREMGLRMLECGYAQGDGQAAYELGLTLGTRTGKTTEYYARALKIYHDGVKFGSEPCAGALSSAFSQIDPVTGNKVDNDRSDRYLALRNALGMNPDLRFPNLDKVLPLPPASLPQWNGNEDALVNAAKGLVRTPASAPTPGAERTGRAHVPPGHLLARPSHPLRPVASWDQVPRTGYWLPQLEHAYQDYEVAWQKAQVPLRHEQGEHFEAPSRASMDAHANNGVPILWTFVGEAVPVVPAVPPRVAQGIARIGSVPQPELECRGHRPCPRTGIWFGYLPDVHPLAARFNRWDRQAYLEEGQVFPDPAALQLDLAASDVRWLWCGNANRVRASGLVDIMVDDHGDQQS